MGAIKTTKVTDYIGDYLATGNLGMESVCISPGGQFGSGYVIPMATRHMVQSSPKVQDVVSFFFKMESAQPVPFLPQSYPILISSLASRHSQVQGLGQELRETSSYLGYVAAGGHASLQ